MGSKFKAIGEGETALVKDSSAMCKIDDMANVDNDKFQLGGEAYKSTYNDKVTITQIINTQSSEDDSAPRRINAALLICMLIGLFILTGIIIAVLLLI